MRPRNGSECKLDAARIVIKAVPANRPIDFLTFLERIEKRIERVVGRQDLRMIIAALKREGVLKDDGRGETRRMWEA
jgi:hypothetical protein